MNPFHRSRKTFAPYWVASCSVPSATSSLSTTMISLVQPATLFKARSIRCASAPEIMQTEMGSFFIVNTNGFGYEELMPAGLAEFYSKTQHVRKIIVVDPGFLGDSIHLTPALWEIKRNYPQASLDVTTTPLGAEFLAMVPCVDQIWPLKRSPQGTPLSEYCRWIRKMRHEKFDVAFNF